jgi:hypothetical protein
MAPPPNDSNGSSAEEHIDANGVDRAQIRQMLALTPEQRLARVQEFVESAQQIWKLNERPIR